jgi:hypothetical protein
VSYKELLVQPDLQVLKEVLVLKVQYKVLEV